MAIDSRSVFGSMSTSIERSRSVPTARHWRPAAGGSVVRADVGQCFAGTIGGAGDGRGAIHTVGCLQESQDFASDQFGSTSVEQD